MSDRQKQKQERLDQIKKGTYIDREDVKTDVAKQKGVKPNVYS